MNQSQVIETGIKNLQPKCCDAQMFGADYHSEECRVECLHLKTQRNSISGNTPDYFECGNCGKQFNEEEIVDLYEEMRART